MAHSFHHHSQVGSASRMSASILSPSGGNRLLAAGEPRSTSPALARQSCSSLAAGSPLSDVSKATRSSSLNNLSRLASSPLRSVSYQNLCAAAAVGSSPAPADVEHVGEIFQGEAGLAEYIAQGPLLGSCGITTQDVNANIMKWARLGKQLAEQLGFNPSTLDDVQRMRIYHYYLPVYFWCDSQLVAHKASGSQQALVIGISAPQGCGKTTLVEQLQELFTAAGNTAVSVSIDDFYLTYQDQSALAASNPSNLLLQYRGNAGTHDLDLGTRTLQAMRALRDPGQSAQVPRYDKSAYAGRGDRAAQSSWPGVQGPVEVVLFEGWMSGFAPLEHDSEAEAVSPGLGAVNAALRAYKAAWDSLVDSWLVVRIADPQWVYKWRLQAEEKMRASGKAGMTDAQIADFVARFQPAYKAYLPGLYAKGPTTARSGHTLIIEVDQTRAPVAQQPAPVV